MRPSFLTFLLCSEDTVSGITETGTDISLLIQLAIKMSYIDLNIRMILVKSL